MKVKVNVDDLVEKLRENQSKHHAAFERALTGWQKECIRILNANIETVRLGKLKSALYLHEQIPSDHTRDYEVVIGLLLLSTTKDVELEAPEYRRFVMDDWDWKQEWTTSTAKYLGGERDGI